MPYNYSFRPLSPIPTYSVQFRTVAVPTSETVVMLQFEPNMSVEHFKGLIRRIAPDQAHFADQIVSVHPYRTANSGSGASFFLVNLRDDPTPYFFKCDVPGSMIVSGEASAYLCLAECGLDRLYLPPKALSVAAPAFIAMEYLKDSITTFDLIADTQLNSEIPTVFKRGMGQFLSLFLEKQVVCKDPEKWFREYTIGRANKICRITDNGFFKYGFWLLVPNRSSFPNADKNLSPLGTVTPSTITSKVSTNSENISFVGRNG